MLNKKTQTEKELNKQLVIFKLEQKTPRKRLFIGLIVGVFVLLSLILFVFWFIPFIGFSNIHESVPYVVGGAFLALLLGIVWVIFTIIFHVITGKSLWGEVYARGVTIKILLPLMEVLGGLFGFSKTDVRLSFIKVNNELVSNSSTRINAEDILVLLPHCIQNSTCTYRINYDIDLCKKCQKCSIANLINLRDKYNIKLAVATGGTIARRIVVTTKPSLIIAVACERDLTSGIQDTHPLPVFGILNMRPEGPCFNTTININAVEAALEYFIKKND